MFSRIDLSTAFDKQIKKAPAKITVAFTNRLVIFANDPYNRQLRNHALKGKYLSFRSIDITGDWRALYSTKNSGNTAVFELLGTHSQLYK